MPSATPAARFPRRPSERAWRRSTACCCRERLCRTVSRGVGIAGWCLDWQLLAKRATPCSWLCLQALLVQQRFVCLPTSQAPPLPPHARPADVQELWSLFDFLMPGLLGSERQFNARYGRMLQVGGGCTGRGGDWLGVGTLPAPCLSAFLASHTPDAIHMSIASLAGGTHQQARQRRGAGGPACGGGPAPPGGHRCLRCRHTVCAQPASHDAGCDAASCLPAGLCAAALFMCSSCQIISPVPLTHPPAGHALHPAAHQGRGAVRPAPQDCAGKHAVELRLLGAVNACSSSMCRWLSNQSPATLAQHRLLAR